MWKINVEDIKIGQKYYLVSFDTGGRFEIKTITPTKVHIDEKLRGLSVLMVYTEENPEHIHWISRKFEINTVEPDKKLIGNWLFDDYKLVKEEIRKHIKEYEDEIQYKITYFENKLKYLNSEFAKFFYESL